MIISTNDTKVTAQVIRDDVIPWQEFRITLMEENPNKERGRVFLAQLDIVIAPLEGKEVCVCVCVFVCVFACVHICGSYK